MVGKAFYLCASGARDNQDLPGAVFRYNHDQSYVNAVLAQAAAYTAPAPGSDAASRAVAFARAQLGIPYLWGGDGPAEGGFDCSGLSKAAYAAAGVGLPRTAQTQFDAGPRLPPGQPIQPGDLVFFGTGPTDVSHVGIAVSATDMIDAPHAGAVVRAEPIWRSTFVGATRPAPPSATTDKSSR